MKIDKQGQDAIQSLILDLVPHLTCDSFLVSPGRGYFRGPRISIYRSLNIRLVIPTLENLSV